MAHERKPQQKAALSKSPAGADSTDRTANARRPMQRRGRETVERILDAAADIIAKRGIADVTMHRLARHSGTSVGSTYHFFPDRNSVLEGLAQRHRAAVAAITEQLADTPVSEWRELSAREVAHRVLDPFAQYVDGHPDYLPLFHYRASLQEQQAFTSCLRRMLDARLPCLHSVDRDHYADMLHAIVAGIMHVGYQNAPHRAHMYLEEIPRVLASYLTTLDRGASQ